MDPKETACNHLGICENVGGLCLHCLNQSWIKSIVNPMLAEKRCPLRSQSIILPSAHKQANKQNFCFLLRQSLCLLTCYHHLIWSTYPVLVFLCSLLLCQSTDLIINLAECYLWTVTIKRPQHH